MDESEGENSESDFFQQQLNIRIKAVKNNKKHLQAVGNPFAEASEKTRGVYMNMLEIFTERDIRRRNHVGFIYAAIKHI
uniref:ECSIT N-terminal domain-containing protein n=1 Tax=Glossina austeni TaxID=7395 RepID=A0A1A9VFN3_GLOAU